MSDEISEEWTWQTPAETGFYWYRERNQDPDVIWWDAEDKTFSKPGNESSFGDDCCFKIEGKFWPVKLSPPPFKGPCMPPDEQTQAIDAVRNHICPKCASDNDDTPVATLHIEWKDNPDGKGGYGFTIFKCHKCGQLLRGYIARHEG